MTDRADRISAEIERPLDADAARAYLTAPISDAERGAVLELWRWFTTRYPTPLDRLAYVRRAYGRWRTTARAGAPSDTAAG